MARPKQSSRSTSLQATPSKERVIEKKQEQEEEEEAEEAELIVS